MKHNNTVAIEDKDMILRENFSSASLEFDMPDVETFLGEGDSSQPLDMQEEDTINDTCLVPLSTLMHIDTVVTRHIPPTRAVSLTVTAETSLEKMRKRKTRWPYRRCTAHQIEKSFDLVIEEGKAAKEAAL